MLDEKVDNRGPEKPPVAKEREIHEKKAMEDRRG
jgi:hypothetical protein